MFAIGLLCAALTAGCDSGVIDTGAADETSSASGSGAAAGYNSDAGGFPSSAWPGQTDFGFGSPSSSGSDAGASSPGNSGSSKGSCGNGMCNGKETCSSCPKDCTCSDGGSKSLGKPSSTDAGTR